MKLQARYRDVDRNDVEALNRYIDWKDRLIDALEGALTEQI